MKSPSNVYKHSMLRTNSTVANHAVDESEARVLVTDQGGRLQPGSVVCDLDDVEGSQPGT